MKAQLIHAFGDPSVFTMENIALPQIAPGQVLIKVNATSVNQIDCKIRSGAVAAIAPTFPAILHSDVAGIVESVGEGVSRFKKGDEVYGCAGGLRGLGGALAEFMLADERLIAKKPTSISMQEAAALPLVSITAWEALFEQTPLKKGAHVLIHGGAGGVGHVAIQLAKWHGTKVYTTVTNDEDAATVKALGAEDAINVKEETVESYKQRLTNDRGFDFIFDTVGGPNLNNSFAAAAINGTVVTTAARVTLDLTPMHSKALHLHCVFMLLPLLGNENREHHGKVLEKLAQVVDEGELKPMIDPNYFTLATTAQAHALLESGKAHGKVVISIP